MAILLGLLVGVLTLAAWWVLQNYTYNTSELWRTMPLARILKRTYLKFRKQDMAFAITSLY